jgi:hypothetical protein
MQQTKQQCSSQQPGYALGATAASMVSYSSTYMSSVSVFSVLADAAVHACQLAQLFGAVYQHLVPHAPQAGLLPCTLAHCLNIATAISALVFRQRWMHL